MTMWIPDLERDAVPGRPRYLAIADALERATERGELRPGDRLPTHRQLADFLGLTVGTATRAYAEAERRGLTTGRVGRGTFVAGRSEETHGWEPAGSSDLVDLALSLPAPLDGDAEGRHLAKTLSEIAGDDSAGRLCRYRTRPSPRHLDAGRAWLDRLGLTLPGHEIALTSGAQHGLLVALSTVLRAGDTLLADALTYPGIKAAARILQLGLEPVAMDEEGMLPSALDEACERSAEARGVYLMPTIQNPTGAVLSESRRRELAEVASRRGLWIVEDDVHAPGLAEPPPPLARHLPERAVYLLSTGKTLGPALRIAYASVPAEIRDRFEASLRATLWTVPPLMAEVATRWIGDGTAERILRARRKLANERQALARRILGEDRLRGHRDSFYVWLTLPAPWRSDELVEQARQRRVLLAGAGAFAVGRAPAPHAVRISLGSATMEDLERGLREVTALLEGGTEPCLATP